METMGAMARLPQMPPPPRKLPRQRRPPLTTYRYVIWLARRLSVVMIFFFFFFLSCAHQFLLMAIPFAEGFCRAQDCANNVGCRRYGFFDREGRSCLGCCVRVSFPFDVSSVLFIKIRPRLCAFLPSSLPELAGKHGEVSLDDFDLDLDDLMSDTKAIDAPMPVKKSRSKRK